MKVTGCTLKFPDTFKLFVLRVFLDGRPQWEVEAKILREKTQGVSSIVFNNQQLHVLVCCKFLY